jgi:hypothetical protein
MVSSFFPAGQPRSQYRYELRSLTYVTLGEGNRGVIRNLSHEGAAIQAVAPLHCGQQVRISIELKMPRCRVEAQGQVSWANSSGQCGIQFIGLSDATRQQIDGWIFSNLLDSFARETANQPIFGAAPVVPIRPEENSHLIVSGTPRPSIRMGPERVASVEPMLSIREERDMAALGLNPGEQLNWLSRPLSARTQVWMVNSLVMAAGFFLFAVIFLAIAHEVPRWQLTLSASLAVVAFVGGAYWALFVVFGRVSLGTRVTRISGIEERKSSP